MPCAPSGLSESPGLLLSNRECADRWPSQSGSLSVKHMQGAVADVMAIITDTEVPSVSSSAELTLKEFLFALILPPVYTKKVLNDMSVKLFRSKITNLQNHGVKPKLI